MDKQYEHKTHQIREYKAIASDKLSHQEIITLYAFKIAMIRNGWQDDYHFGNYSEQRLCIYKNGDFWEVYTTERGNAFFEAIMSDVTIACLHAIKHLADSSQIEREAIKLFQELLKKEYTKEELEEFLMYHFDKQSFTEEDVIKFREYNQRLEYFYTDTPEEITLK